MLRMNAKNWLVALLIVVYLITCMAVGYNAVVSARPEYIVPNIYFERPTPQPEYNNRA